MNGVPLYTIDLAVGEKLSGEEVLHSVEQEYTRHIQRNPKDLLAWRGRINVHLRFNHIDEARELCREMLAAMPDDWWTVLTNALLVAKTDHIDRGKELITNWVKKDENFFRYLDLAYFHHLTHQPREAAAAIVKSTEFDADTTWGEDGNSEYRGYTAAMCAYRAGDYEAVIKLCDHLLPVKINRDYCKEALRNLKAASDNAMHGGISPFDWNGDIHPFDPFEEFDIEKLLAKPVPRPTKNQPWAIMGTIPDTASTKQPQ